MEERLSKKQENVLVVLCEGSLMEEVRTGDLWLEDADKNCYHIRKDTFYILKMGGYIAPRKSSPSIEMELFSLTDKGKEYLKQHCLEQIQDFI